MKTKEELSKEIIKRSSEIEKIYFANERSLSHLDSRLDCFDNVSWIDYELYCCDMEKDETKAGLIINAIQDYIAICESHGADSRFVYDGAIKNIWVKLQFIKNHVRDYISQIEF